MADLALYDFPRSSSSYRVRIALALKGLRYEKRLVNFREDEQRSADFLARAPAGLVPALQTTEGQTLTQSVAIIQYLDSIAEPLLFPRANPLDQAQIWSMVLDIACDIHPLNNLRVLNYLQGELAADVDAKETWYRHWIARGFEALECRVGKFGGKFCYGDNLTAVDVCLVPQMYNARRFNTDLGPFPKLVEYDHFLREHPAFVEAAPE
ncbi:maleylacetoacetate isomerase [Parasphingopyxis sp.]|uniref:maleylacetoacetate isomerase n=1 Tax=Parasphingopyxis sp. TaxID=1920299 RepID=UPI0026175A7F|nr:maleylacetoacetate isomerase [Parasphingopyxis sp.]